MSQELPPTQRTSSSRSWATTEPRRGFRRPSGVGRGGLRPSCAVERGADMSLQFVQYRTEAEIENRTFLRGAILAKDQARGLKK